MKYSQSSWKRCSLFLTGSSRFLYKISVLSIITLAPLSGFAGILISEIMYDALGSDTGREWVEIQNTEPTSVDIAGWKLFEAGVNHKIVAHKGTLLSSGEYAVITSNTEKFLADWPAFPGLLFQSSFSLKNTGEALVIKNASSSVIASVTYSAGKGEGDGNSLNFTGEAWGARKPSPGSAISDEVVPPPVVKSAAKSVKKTGNVSEASKVSTTDSVAYEGESSISGEDELAAVSAAGSENNQSFAMLPWIVALFTIVGIAGTALFLKDGKTPKGSGYTIVEEK